MPISNTAISTLAANVKWKPSEAEAMFVAEMPTGHIRSALGCCVRKAPFENNGLNHNEWYDIFNAELEAREGGKREELVKLKESMKEQRKAILCALESHSDDVNRAINLARDLDYQTEYLEDYIIKAGVAIYSLR